MKRKKKTKKYHQIVRLNNEERQNPHMVVADFFSNYHLSDVRRAMWEWLSTAFASKDIVYTEGTARSELLFLYENVEKLIEASYIINHRVKHKSSNPPIT